MPNYTLFRVSHNLSSKDFKPNPVADEKTIIGSLIFLIFVFSSFFNSFSEIKSDLESETIIFLSTSFLLYFFSSL